MPEEKEILKESSSPILNKRSRVLIFGVGIILGLAAGYAAGVYLGGNSFQQGLIQGRNEMEQEYEEKLEQIFPSFEEPDEIYSVYGEITSIEGEVLTVEQVIHSANPLKDPETKMWRVEVNEDTELVRLLEISPEEIEAADGELTDPFIEEEISFSELEPGDMVYARSAENIKDKEQFQAQKIEVEFEPVMVEPTPESPEIMPEELLENTPEDF